MEHTSTLTLGRRYDRAENNASARPLEHDWSRQQGSLPAYIPAREPASSEYPTDDVVEGPGLHADTNTKAL